MILSKRGADFEKTNSDVQGIQFAVASKPPLQAAVVMSCYWSQNCGRSRKYTASFYTAIYTWNESHWADLETNPFYGIQKWGIQLAWGCDESPLRNHPYDNEWYYQRYYRTKVDWWLLFRMRLGCVSKVESMTAERKKLTKPKGNHTISRLKYR